VASPVRSVHTGLTQRLVFGPQALDEVPTLVREVGCRRVLLITTEGRAESEGGRRLVQRLGRVVADVFSGAAPHVPTSILEGAVSAARSAGVDGIVSLGGGSCADLAKAVCWFLERESGAKIGMVSTGPERDQTMTLPAFEDALKA